LNLDLGKASKKQWQFLTDHHRHVAYGGARGGGKSWAVRAKAILLACKHPGIKIIIIRRTYKELMNNHIEPLRKMLNGVAKYNGTDKLFKFTNGSTISFGYCYTDADLGQYQGAEYDVIFFDEAGQLQEHWIKEINVCVRGVNQYPKRSYYTLNPGGPSHAYFKRLFIDRQFKADENPEDYSFIQALVQDNDALMATQPEYLRELENLPPKLREAWLYGRWDVFSGQFFEDFRTEPDPEHGDILALKQQRQWTHVIEPFDIPRGWTIYRSYDWGYAKPFSCGWYAVDYDGIIYRILELYGCTETPNEGVKWTTDRQFSEIKRVEEEHPWLKGQNIIGIADPSIWDGSKGESVAETATRHGVIFTPGDNKRLAGWMQCHYRLQFDENGIPMFYVFNTCEQFIRTIPTLIYDDRQVEDLNTDGEDHIADEWRYMCMSRPLTPKREVKPNPLPQSDPLNQLARRVKQYE